MLNFIEGSWNFRSERYIFKEENGAFDDSTVLQSDVKKSLKIIRINNINKLIFLVNRFKGSIDIFMVSETN